MKYYIEYPIPNDCFLQCEYCFHTSYFKKQRGEEVKETYIKDITGENKPIFTLEEYITWRNTHLKDAEEIIMHLAGGEPSDLRNHKPVFEILEKCNVERIEIQTNGIGLNEFYNRLEKYKHKIHRVIFTFHRTVIGDKTEFVKKYEDHVMLVNSFGIPVIVKELLFKKHREAILHNKKYWQDKGIRLQIQDFKGMDHGLSYEEYKNYSPIDHLIVDNEYKHFGPECGCRQGYKNILIRGYDFCSDDIIACWFDPQKVIGSIKNNTYNPNYKIVKTANGIDVNGIERIERGKQFNPNCYYEDDVYTPEK